MGKPVEQRSGHFGVTKHGRPFTEGQVGGDDDRGALVKPADQMEQELAAGLGERQITKFVEDEEVQARELIGKPPLTVAAGFGLQPVDEVDDVVKAAPGTGADAASGHGNGKMGFAGAGSAVRLLRPRT